MLGEYEMMKKSKAKCVFVLIKKFVESLFVEQEFIFWRI